MYVGDAVIDFAFDHSVLFPFFFLPFLFLTSKSGLHHENLLT